MWNLLFICLEHISTWCLWNGRHKPLLSRVVERGRHVAGHLFPPLSASLGRKWPAREHLAAHDAAHLVWVPHTCSVGNPAPMHRFMHMCTAVPQWQASWDDSVILNHQMRHLHNLQVILPTRCSPGNHLHASPANVHTLCKCFLAEMHIHHVA